LKRVLIVSPTSERHSYIIEKFLETIKKIDYPCFDLYLTDTTPNKKWLKRIMQRFEMHKGHVKNVYYDYHKWDDSKQHVLRMLSDVREKQRLFAKKKGYDYMLITATDFLMKPNIIKKLMKRDKDVVVQLCHMYPKEKARPSVLPTGFITIGKGLDGLTWEQIEEIKKQGKDLIQVWGAGGPTLMKRKVIEEAEWKTHQSYLWGEDCWWFSEVENRGFELWVDLTERTVHENTYWEGLEDKVRGPKTWVAFGTEYGDKEKEYKPAIIDRGEECVSNKQDGRKRSCERSERKNKKDKT